MRTNTFDRMFPNQDKQTGKGFGNLIALPWQEQGREQGNTLFMDPKTDFLKPFEDQARVFEEALQTRIPRSQIDNLISDWNLKQKEDASPDVSDLADELLKANRQNDAKEYPLADYNQMRSECGFIAHCENDAKVLPEEDWYAGLTNVVRCENGTDIAQHISKPYPTYNDSETRAKIEHAISDSGPMKCTTIKKINPKYCKACSHWGLIKSPIVLGLTKAAEETAQSAIEEINAKHAVIMIGGKCTVINQTVDPVFNRPDISFSSKGDFLNLYANRKIPNPLAPTKQISIGKIWWESPDRKQYDGLVFEPQKDFDGYYNLWRGFSVEPKKGDWSLMEKLIRDAISSGNESRYQYILAWMARILQDPGGQRPGVAFVMRGRQGIGKGVFSTEFGALLSGHFLQVAQAGQVTGRFNTHLKDCVVLFVDEGFWAGDKQAEGVIKNLVTEPTITVEPKGKDLFKVKNNVNIIIASNSDWVVPAGLEERRFFTVDVDDCFKGDYTFFRKLTAQMDNGGREAMLYDLQKMDISGVNLRDFERTDALLDQILESMSLVQKWWFNQLRRGAIRMVDYGDEFGPHRDEWPTSASNEQLYDSFEMFVAKIHGYLPIPEVFGRQLNKLIVPVEIIRPRTPDGAPRRRLRVIPELTKCREVFEEKLEMKVDWEDEKYEMPPF